MCVPDTLLIQAFDWMFDDLWNLADHDRQYDVEFAINDLVHLENQVRGKIGYNPDFTFDFAIGL